MNKAKCIYCDYEWNTESKMINVTCPNCQKKTKIKIIKGKNNEMQNK